MATQNTNVPDGSGGIVGRIDDWLGEDQSIGHALAVYGALALYFIWFLVPVLWLALSTIKTGGIIQANELIIVPSLDQITFSNYETVLGDAQFRRMFLNSVVIAFSTTLLTVAVSVLGAYSLSRFSYPGRKSLLVAFMATKMLPPVLIIIPFFLMMYSLTLVNTYVGIILAHCVRALPLALWLLKGFFDDIPQALDEAARIDGCSHLKVLYHVIVPLAKPGIAVAAFYTFVTSWNDFLFVSILSQGMATRTLPFGLYLFQGANTINWGATLTAATLTAIPSILFFALVQKYIVKGLASGGMHGS